jgi:hypothetical protein
LYLPLGDFALVFEGESGSADLFTLSRIEKLLGVLELSKTVPKLVFLSACHSELAGHLFVKAGCQHVIACRASERVMDLTARLFMQFFYRALFQGKTVEWYVL